MTDVLAAAAHPGQRVRLRDWPVACWLVSRAFAHGNTALAVLLLPAMFLSVFPAILMGGAWWQDRTGFVLVVRNRAVLMQVFGVVAILPVIAVMMVALGVVAFLPWWANAAVWLLILLAGMWLLVSAVLQLATSAGALSVTGSETPKGERWLVAAMAQAPGTRLTAVLLTRRLVAALPEGAIVVATAASTQLLQHYLRLGFTQGKGKRVFMVMGNR